MSRIEDNYSHGVVSDARHLPDSDFYAPPDIAPLELQAAQHARGWAAVDTLEPALLRLPAVA